METKLPRAKTSKSSCIRVNIRQPIFLVTCTGLEFFLSKFHLSTQQLARKKTSSTRFDTAATLEKKETTSSQTTQQATPSEMSKGGSQKVLLRSTWNLGAVSSEQKHWSLRLWMIIPNCSKFRIIRMNREFAVSSISVTQTSSKLLTFPVQNSLKIEKANTVSTKQLATFCTVLAIIAPLPDRSPASPTPYSIAFPTAYMNSFRAMLMTRMQVTPCSVTSNLCCCPKVMMLIPACSRQRAISLKPTSEAPTISSRRKTPFSSEVLRSESLRWSRYQLTSSGAGASEILMQVWSSQRSLRFQPCSAMKNYFISSYSKETKAVPRKWVRVSSGLEVVAQCFWISISFSARELTWLGGQFFDFPSTQASPRQFELCCTMICSLSSATFSRSPMLKHRFTDLTGLAARRSELAERILSQKLSSRGVRDSVLSCPLRSTLLLHLVAWRLKKSLRASLTMMLGLLVWTTSALVTLSAIRRISSKYWGMVSILSKGWFWMKGKKGMFSTRTVKSSWLYFLAVRLVQVLCWVQRQNTRKRTATRRQTTFRKHSISSSSSLAYRVSAHTNISSSPFRSHCLGCSEQYWELALARNLKPKQKSTRSSTQMIAILAKWKQRQVSADISRGSGKSPASDSLRGVRLAHMGTSSTLMVQPQQAHSRSLTASEWVERQPYLLTNWWNSARSRLAGKAYLLRAFSFSRPIRGLFSLWEPAMLTPFGLSRGFSPLKAGESLLGSSFIAQFKSIYIKEYKQLEGIRQALWLSVDGRGVHEVATGHCTAGLEHAIPDHRLVLLPLTPLLSPLVLGLPESGNEPEVYQEAQLLLLQLPVALQLERTQLHIDHDLVVALFAAVVLQREQQVLVVPARRPAETQETEEGGNFALRAGTLRRLHRQEVLVVHPEEMQLQVALELDLVRFALNVDLVCVLLQDAPPDVHLTDVRVPFGPGLEVGQGQNQVLKFYREIDHHFELVVLPFMLVDPHLVEQLGPVRLTQSHALLGLGRRLGPYLGVDLYLLELEQSVQQVELVAGVHGSVDILRLFHRTFLIDSFIQIAFFLVVRAPETLLPLIILRLLILARLTYQAHNLQNSLVYGF